MLIRRFISSLLNKVDKVFPYLKIQQLYCTDSRKIEEISKTLIFYFGFFFYYFSSKGYGRDAHDGAEDDLLSLRRLQLGGESAAVRLVVSPFQALFPTRRNFGRMILKRFDVKLICNELTFKKW